MRNIRRFISSLAVLSVLGLTALTYGQDTNPPDQPSQPAQGRASGQRGGRGAWGGGGMMGRGVMGTVTEVAPDHYTVKTETGELYTIHYSVNTRIMKGGGGRRRGQADNEPPMTPPEAIKASDIKVGDAIAASPSEPLQSFKSIPSAPDSCARCRPTTAKPGSWEESTRSMK